jgi:hypothetical protein
LFVNSYGPLVATRAGIDAAKRHGLAPFIDGSIRREPDLEHATPTISCLCRTDKFAPRLRLGDVVAYMTKKGTYGEGPRHRRLVAILRVARLFDSHDDAAAWFASRRERMPSNCMTKGNPPSSIDCTHQSLGPDHPDNERFTREWDSHYRVRANDNGRFVVCDSLWRDLDWTAPRLSEHDLKAVFGRVPGTRNPGAWPIHLVERLAEQAGISLE